jgi:hypothetical protein
VIKLPPIYTEAYHLAGEMLRHTAHVPKMYRPTLGRRMEEAALDVVVILRHELLKNAPMDLRGVGRRVDELKVLIQLSHDMGILRDQAFGELATTTDKIGKMIGGLERHGKRPKALESSQEKAPST